MFGRVRTYTVHVKDSIMDDENVRFVREGFNIAAFLFGPFWAFYQRLWIAGGVVIALQAIAIKLVQTGLLSDAGSSMVQALLGVALGVFGNDLVRHRLQRTGFVFTDVVIAENETRATQRFLDHAAV